MGGLDGERIYALCQRAGVEREAQGLFAASWSQHAARYDDQVAVR